MPASKNCSHIVLLALTAAFLSPLAAAQSYPDRPIRIVVPYLAGGGVDTAARVVGQPLGEHLGQAVLVDNRPGAATNIGADMVAKARADGYTDPIYCYIHAIGREHADDSTVISRYARQRTDSAEQVAQPYPRS